MLHHVNIANLKADLESRIVGQVKPAWRCCCGALSKPASKAVSVNPAGNYVYQGERCEHQADLYYLWNVEMDNNYSTGLSDFISNEEIETLFAKHRPLFTKE